MPHRMQELASEIVRLQAELDREIEKRRKVLGWKLKDRIVEFEHGIAVEHRHLRMNVTSFLAKSSVGVILTAPVIYSLILPLLLIDGWVSLYQAVCFRVYRIPRVQRAEFIVFDRQHLRYLNWIEALRRRASSVRRPGLPSPVRRAGTARPSCRPG